MNQTEYKTYIDKLCTTSNNYYLYDEEYIKNKYNIGSYDKFRKYFKKYHSDKLIFNSEKAELFFIKVMNLDTKFVTKKYADNLPQVIVDFFIKRNECSFNECEEFNKLKFSKLHLSDCKCKIKVKSVVNLSINALIFILMEYNASFTNANTEASVLNSNKSVEKQSIAHGNQIVKLYNSQSNKKIIDCINNIETAKNNLGLYQADTLYQLTDTKPNVKILDTIVQVQTIDIPCEINLPTVLLSTDVQRNETNDHLLCESINTINTINTKKYDEQLISDSINLNESEDAISQKNINNDCRLSDNKRFDNLTQYALNVNNVNNNNRQFNVEDIESDSSVDSNNKNCQSETINPDNSTGSTNSIGSGNQNNTNNTNDSHNSDSSSDSATDNSHRFGNVVIKENKVKIEKKQPVDLNNSSDILVSYNENEQYDKKYIMETENKHNTKDKTVIGLKKELIKTNSDKTIINDDAQNKTSEIKKDVIDILNNLNANFNYITSDDILIDKDKKMQICTFMVEVKYKIFGMFRQLEKQQKVNLEQKNKISNCYEKVYQYVVQSNKIGSTGEMVEFNNNKRLIRNIIEDIMAI